MAKFNKLDVPHQWKDEFTKYPHGYTIFEALCKWVKQVDNMVDNINNWNDYLDGFVDNFDSELQQTVQSTITKWQNEGLLDSIIESALNTELDKVNTQLVEIEKNIKEHPQASIELNHLLSFECESGIDEQTIKQGWLQGFCVVNNNIVLARISSYKKTNDVVLTEISMDTMQVLREETLPLGHANDLEYLPHTNEILCSPSTKYIDGVSTSVKEIIVIDYTSLTLKRVVEVEGIPTGIGFDKKTGDLAYKNNHRVYFVDSDFNTIRIVDCDNLNDGSIGQGMCLDNGYIFMNRSLPESIHIWDKEGKIQRVYSLPEYSDQNFYIYETESIKPLGDGKYLLGAVKSKDSSRVVSVFDFFVIDIFGKNKTIGLPKNTSHLRRDNRRIKDIYVDSTYAKLDANGSYIKPFKDLQSAVNVCNDPKYHYAIRLSPGNYGYTDLNNLHCKVSIFGGNLSTRGNYTINGIKVYNANYVEVNGCTITRNPSDTSSVRLNDSAIRLLNCAIVGSSNAEGISCSNSKVWISGTSLIKDCRHGFYLNSGSYGIITDTMTFENCQNSEVYAEGSSFCRVNPNVVLNKIRTQDGGDVYYKNPGLRTALAYYRDLDISMMVNSKGCIEPTENVSIDAINYAGLYYLNPNVTDKPATGNMYLQVISSGAGHCVQTCTSNNTSDYTQYMRKGIVSGGVTTWGQWKSITYD